MLAEALGTFALVFAGTGAIVIDGIAGGVIGHLGVALSFGLVVMVMIQAVGDVSGAHLNPAVTVGFWLSGRLERQRVLPYAIAQLAGAVVASAVLRAMFPEHGGLGATLPREGFVVASVALEVLLTGALMFVILSVSTGAQEKGITAGIAIGATVGLAALFAGPISGASMNPARSLGPALLSGQPEWLWIYLTAPFLGAWLAVGACRVVRCEPACCPGVTRAAGSS